jgi:hypothetical protein
VFLCSSANIQGYNLMGTKFDQETKTQVCVATSFGYQYEIGRVLLNE